MSFPIYPDYVDSPIRWLHKQPSKWSAKPVKAIATINDETLSDAVDPDHEIEYVDIGSVSLTNGIEKTEAMAFGESPSRARRVPREGDVLVSTVRTYLKAIAPVVNQPSNLVASTGFAVIRPKPELKPGFLKYALQEEHFIQEVISRSTGVSYPAINASDIGRVLVCFPSRDEQLDISTFLDRETAKIDALIAEQQHLIDLLQEKRQAVISHAVTKGLNPNAPMKDSGVEWLGEVPEHWHVKPLKHLAAVQTGMAKGKDLEGLETADIPYLRVANVQDGYLDLEEVHLLSVPITSIERYLLKKGDVLMNEGGDFDKLGRGCIWSGEIEPCVHQNHVFAVRPHSISGAWLNAFTTSKSANSYFISRSKQSTNLASISSTNLMGVSVPVPPDDEANEILERLGQRIQEIDALKGSAKQAINLLQERRSALISAAVTGQIDVQGLVEAEASEQ